MVMCSARSLTSGALGVLSFKDVMQESCSRYVCCLDCSEWSVIIVLFVMQGWRVFRLRSSGVCCNQWHGVFSLSISLFMQCVDLGGVCLLSYPGQYNDVLSRVTACVRVVCFFV